MRLRLDLWTVVIIAGALSVTMGHSGGCCSDSVLGPPTGTTCPPNSTLTYENFGAPFMESYCTDCHSSELTGDDRMGAEAFHDFDTVEGIRQVSNHVDQVAGSGPEATNESMPPDDEPQPTLEERQKLAEWIACEMPTDEDLAEDQAAR